MVIAAMQAELAGIAAAPAEEALSLPGRFYTSPEWFAHEAEMLLRREWHCLGRADEIPAPGDYFTAQLLDEPLLVVRGDDGEVRVLANVCRHRGMPVAEGSGSTRRFVCPYHGWSYHRDGRLARAPRMRHRGVAPGACALPAIRSELWGGFIHASLDEDAAPLTPRLGGLGALLAEYHPEEMRLVHVAEEDWRCNWKCLVENFMEAYHLSVVHPETLHGTTPTGLSRKAMADGAFTSYCANYPAKIPPRGIGAIGLSPEERHRSTLFCLYPAQVASQAASLLVSLSLQPVAADHVRVRWTMSVFGDDLTGDDIDARIALWTEVNREDRDKLERLQAALGSRHAVSGPLAPPDFEGTIHDFYRYLAQGIGQAAARAEAV